jgi:hypothetical protein
MKVPNSADDLAHLAQVNIRVEELRQNVRRRRGKGTVGCEDLFVKPPHEFDVLLRHRPAQYPAESVAFHAKEAFFVRAHRSWSLTPSEEG